MPGISADQSVKRLPAQKVCGGRNCKACEDADRSSPDGTVCAETHEPLLEHHTDHSTQDCTYGRISTQHASRSLSSSAGFSRTLLSITAQNLMIAKLQRIATITSCGVCTPR